MSSRLFPRFAIALGWFLLFVAGDPADAADVTIRVAADRPAHAVSPELVGIFFEDINFAGDGGLNAELIKNGSLEFPVPLMGWRPSPGNGDGRIETSIDAPCHAANPTYLRIENRAAAPLGVVNEGFRGMGFRAGEPYRFSAQARSLAGATVDVHVRLLAATGAVLAEATLPLAGSEWRAISAELTPAATEQHGALEIRLESPGLVDLDMASLSPVHTWRDRPHGLRADLAQKLADLKPGFFRFPGGCIVEGSQLKYRYQWKTTIGDLPDRRLLFNRWNTEFAHRLTPDYFQSFGVGFYEFFQLSEEIGAAPLPILNCGMACQFNSKELVGLDDLQPYIQDALDLVEFANGSVDTRWGARRAALGHPKPFGLTMLGVGNEQWGEQYVDRYERFAAALKKRHPKIKLVSGAGPFPVGPDFDFAWPRLRAAGADVVDEHSYACPDWFLREATRFDGYPRQGPKVFMGEYAAQSIDICSPDNRNNLRCALAEAAFLTGIERNSDIVAMSCYAPLFGHEQAWQWRPNLIWFDNLDSYATPNYYVQQLFSQHRGDVVVPVTIEDSRPLPTHGGRIGVGTNDATAEFRDFAVIKGYAALWGGKSLTGVDLLEAFRGRWELNDGVLAQTAPRATCRALFGDNRWADCVVRMKARKVDGPGGFAVFFRCGAGGSYLQWNVGAANNTQHTLQAFQARHSTENPQVAAVPGAVEAGRWYDLRVELKGAAVRCYLDDKLVHDATVEPLRLPQIYAVAGRDDNAKEIVVKAVHVGDQPAAATFDLAGAAVSGDEGTAIVLAGDPDAVNSLADPEKIKPHASTFAVEGAKIDYTLAPSSLTVLRIPIK